LGNDVRSRATALGLEAEQADKGAQQFETGHLAVAVIEVRKPTDKIPELEQTYAVGGVCLALLNAALASGWGANWLSGWPSHDRGFMMQALGLAPHERIAGFIHIGTETSAPPDRPRPDLDQIVTWHDA
jgi:nitroreductase